jgi:preprotein translocase subunit SecG
MSLIKYLLLGIEVLLSILLIGIILLQRSKEQGLGLAFGAGMGEALFGSQVGNVLTKATMILAVLFMLNTLALGRMFSAAPTYTSAMGDLSQPPATGAPAGGPQSTLPPPMALPPTEGADVTPVAIPEPSGTAPATTPEPEAVPAAE